MIVSRVTPPTEEEEAEVDGAEGVGGATDPNRLKHSCALLHLTIVASMAYIMRKWSETGKGTEKWRKILMIAEEKISLSQVAVSLYMSRIERIK